MTVATVYSAYLMFCSVLLSGAHLCCVEHLQGGDVGAGGQAGGRQTTENQQSTQHGERRKDYIRGRSEAWVGAALLYTAQILAEIRRGYVRSSKSRWENI